MKNPRNNNGISPKKNAGVLHGKTLLIAAGGTGGHISPGVSVAEAWLAESGSVLFATLQKNIDYPDIVRLARNEKAAIVAYDTPRLTKNPLQILNFFKRFFAAYRLLKRAARAERVDAVLGMGGYSSFPAVCFALFNRKPLFLCEQNARWGVVTRLGRFFARNIFLSFETQKPLSAKYRVTGNPLRAMFKGLVLSPIKKTRPQKKPLLFFLG
ncbi:MAG TPA: UDP-N-acetylglucosamine--N-acetylmuramyl-(pentapeptide) pyrophosphoryl-undecaprenol N-acetylglucosamine transferase, partial [Turneriella sp.]|nr:UDP-N-acetylglucosamine--N-acetylmuramyl-(pentapeptide) pyrophosphoryl-undecaprenol N-acetylglucosamine transferase [Turneriella sp.]